MIEGNGRKKLIESMNVRKLLLIIVSVSLVVCIIIIVIFLGPIISSVYQLFERPFSEQEVTPDNVHDTISIGIGSIIEVNPDPSTARTDDVIVNIYCEPNIDPRLLDSSNLEVFIFKRAIWNTWRKLFQNEQISTVNVIIYREYTKVLDKYGNTEDVSDIVRTYTMTKETADKIEDWDIAERYMDELAVIE